MSGGTARPRVLDNEAVESAKIGYFASRKQI